MPECTECKYCGRVLLHNVCTTIKLKHFFDVRLLIVIGNLSLKILPLIQRRFLILVIHLRASCTILQYVIFKELVTEILQFSCIIIAALIIRQRFGNYVKSYNHKIVKAD